MFLSSNLGTGGVKSFLITCLVVGLSVEIPSPESLVTIRNSIPEYQMKVNISSKPLKRKMIEVQTTLTYENPKKKKISGFFQIKYASSFNLTNEFF